LSKIVGRAKTGGQTKDQADRLGASQKMPP